MYVIWAALTFASVQVRRRSRRFHDYKAKWALTVSSLHMSIKGIRSCDEH